MLELNKTYNEDCLIGLQQLDDNSIDLTVTSPPYDNLRTYGQTLDWNFEIFQQIAKELYRVTKPGGVVVWIVGDAVIDGSETGTSFKQALYFKEECGFRLHDTMIYEKNGSSRPAHKNSKRYSQIFEYMFVFTKGEIRKDITLIADKRNKWAGWAKWGRNSSYDVDGNLTEVKKNQPVIAEFSLRNNLWKYSVSFNDKTGHPAVFPEKLAEDHILSWSNEGDIVLDPFMGSGTTAKMALLNKRNYIGFEKNTEYYEKSLERVAKYEGKLNEDLSTINCDADDGDMELQYSTTEDKELEGKTKLWNEYIEQLNQYFNEQTLGTLKTLKFNFVTKTNENRVKSILGENETEITPVQEQPEPKPIVVEPKVSENVVDLSICIDDIVNSVQFREKVLSIIREERETLQGTTPVVEETVIEEQESEPVETPNTEKRTRVYKVGTVVNVYTDTNKTDYFSTATITAYLGVKNGVHCYLVEDESVGTLPFEVSSNFIKRLNKKTQEYERN